jgi:hypothetical protein
VQKTFDFALGGGLDLVTPPAVIKPGRLIGCKNYEPFEEGGYARIEGYERFDGRASPSAASYSTLMFDVGTGTLPGVGSVVTGQTSGATGDVVVALVIDSGTFAGSDAVGYLVISNVVGTFQDNETLSFTGAGDAFSSGFSSGFS